MDEEGLIQQIHQALPVLSGQHAQELAFVINRIVSEVRPSRIYVFGSQARDDARDDSDVDLLLVTESAEIPAHRVAQAAYRAAGPCSFSLDILAMPQETFDRRSRAVATFPSTVLREGRLLFAA